MGTYRIIDSQDRTQLGPAIEGDALSVTVAPLEDVFSDELLDRIDLEKLDQASGRWFLVCRVVRVTREHAFRPASLDVEPLPSPA